MIWFFSCFALAYDACRDIGGCAYPEVQPAVEAFDGAPNQETVNELIRLADKHFSKAGDALQCRIGGAAIFWKLGQVYLDRSPERAHNLHQLAMSFFWDLSRLPQGMECLSYGLWGLDFFNGFMDQYLSLAHTIKRHTVESLRPFREVPKDHRNNP